MFVVVKCGDILIGNTSNQWGWALYKFILNESDYQVTFNRDSTEPVLLELSNAADTTIKYGQASYAEIDDSEIGDYAAQTLSLTLSDATSYYLEIVTEFPSYPYNVSIQCLPSSVLGIFYLIFYSFFFFIIYDGIIY